MLWVLSCHWRKIHFDFWHLGLVCCWSKLCCVASLWSSIALNLAGVGGWRLHVVGVMSVSCALCMVKFGLLREATWLIKGKVNGTCSAMLLLTMLRSTVIHHVMIAVITEASVSYAIVEVWFVIRVQRQEVLLGLGGDGRTPRDERLTLSGKATHSGTLFQITIIFIYAWKSRGFELPKYLPLFILFFKESSYLYWMNYYPQKTKINHYNNS